MTRFIGSLSLALVACITPSEEEISSTQMAITTPNGLVFNGLGSNGLLLNGLGFSGRGAHGLFVPKFNANPGGIMLNGLTLNGLLSNGLGISGIDSAGLAAPGAGVDNLSVRGFAFRGDYTPGTAVGSVTANGTGLLGFGLGGLYLHGKSVGGIALNGLAMNGLAVGNLGLTERGLDGLNLNPLGNDEDDVILIGDGQGEASPLAPAQEEAFFRVLSYVAACALPGGDSVTLFDSLDSPHSFAGEHGLAPNWKTGSISESEEDLVQSCLAKIVDIDPAGHQGWLPLNQQQEQNLRKVLSYVIQCALPGDASVTIDHAYNGPTEYAGALGLAPEWQTGSLSTAGAERVSACLMARTNQYGMHVSISLRSPELAPTPEEKANYAHHEGGFMGNLFLDTPVARVCAGRDGMWQSGRQCAGGDCGFEVVGDCSEMCAFEESTGLYSDCTDGVASYEHVINTFMYTNVDLRSLDDLPRASIQSDLTPNPIAPTTSSLNSMVAADFTGDGIHDLVVSAHAFRPGFGTYPAVTEYTLNLLPGSDSEFSDPIKLDSWRARSLAADDIDGDGDIDIISGSGAVFYNDGTGNFEKVASGVFGDKLVIVDVTGDGVDDLVTGTVSIPSFNVYGLQVQLLEGYGDGTFADPVPIYTTTTSRVNGYDTTQGLYLTAGDLNDDGAEDLLVSIARRGPVPLLNSLGGWLALPAIDSPLEGLYGGQRPHVPPVLADFDGDGTLDLAAGTLAGLQWAKGTGQGDFEPLITVVPTPPFSSEGLVKGLAARDVDGDGIADLAVARLNEVSLFRGGTEGVALTGDHFVAFSDGTALLSVQDRDNDGVLDLIVASYSSITTYPGKGDTLGAPVLYENDGPAFISDVDGDDLPDVITTMDGQPTVFQSNGDGTFTQSELDHPVGLPAFINDDDLTDYLVGTTSWIADGSGGFSEVATGTFRTAHIAGDLNGDGLADFVTASRSGGTPSRYTTNISTSLGNGDGTFAGQTVIYQIKGDVKPRDLVDLDGDGYLDLVTENLVTDRLRAYKGMGDGDFTPTAAFTWDITDSNLSHVWGDMNEDGHLDLVFSKRVYFGRGDGSLPLHIDINDAGPKANVQVGDFDGDNHRDIAFPTSTGVGVMLGNGAGTFSLPVTFDYIPNGKSLVATDFNGDGLTDLLIAGDKGITFAIAEFEFPVDEPPTDDGTPPETPQDTPMDEMAGMDGGCGCQSTSSSNGSLALFLLAVFWRRRRRFAKTQR